MDIEKMKIENGSVNVDGIEYVQLYPAAADSYGTSGKVWYCADAIRATDADAADPQRYRITWECVDLFCEDESDACDWRHPISVKAV